MDRLTKRFSNGQAAVAGCGSNCKYDYKYCGEEMGACPTLSAVYEALARYEEAEEQELTCSSCKHESTDEDEYPCSECSRGYTDLFEPKPKKTRQSEFLKLFPNARLISGVLGILPCRTEGRGFEERNCESYCNCVDCRKAYWLKEVE